MTNFCEPVLKILNLLPWNNNEFEDDHVSVIVLATFDGDYDLWSLVQYAEHFQPAWKYGLFHRRPDTGWKQIHLFPNPWPNIPWVEAATLVRQYCLHHSTDYHPY